MLKSTTKQLSDIYTEVSSSDACVLQVPKALNCLCSLAVDFVLMSNRNNLGALCKHEASTIFCG